MRSVSAEARARRHIAPRAGTGRFEAVARIYFSSSLRTPTMSIEVKCNSCSTKYSVADKFAGGSVKCSKCLSPIHVPIVPRQPPPVPAADAAEAAELAFDYVPNLAKAAVAVSTSVEAPAAAPAVPLSSSDAQAVESGEIDKPPTAARRSLWRFSLAWFKLPAKPSDKPSLTGTPAFDFRFRGYWTAALVRLLWVLSVGASIYLVFIEVRQFASQGDPWMLILRIVGIAAALAVVRIGLEAVSVLFDIAKTLRELREDFQTRAIQ
jgi:hypothetical protein